MEGKLIKKSSRGTFIIIKLPSIEHSIMESQCVDIQWRGRWEALVCEKHGNVICGEIYVIES
jgi:hypothetical protein